MNYDISIKERKGILYAYYYQDGRLCRKSLKLKATKPNMAYAKKQIVPNLQVDLAKGKKLFTENKISVFFDKIMKRHSESKAPSTLVTYDVAFRHFLDYFGDRAVENFSVLDLDAYIEHLRTKKKCSSVTLRVYLAPISLIFKEAIRLDFISKNPVTYAIKPMLSRPKRRVYTVTQIWQLLENADLELQKFLYIAFFAGMRAGEIIALRWDDLNFSKNTISISKSKGYYGLGKTKSRRDRVIPMMPKLCDYLNGLNRDRELLFKIGYLELRRRFKNLCERLGFFYEGLHNTRHTFASLMLMARENPLLLKEMLGHTTMQMINEVYGHYMQDNEDCSKFGSILAQRIG